MVGRARRWSVSAVLRGGGADPRSRPGFARARSRAAALRAIRIAATKATGAPREGGGRVRPLQRIYGMTALAPAPPVPVVAEVEPPVSGLTALADAPLRPALLLGGSGSGSLRSGARCGVTEASSSRTR